MVDLPSGYARVAALLRAELGAEASAGFPRLRHIPSTGVVQALDYFETLTPSEFQELVDGLAQRGAVSFFPRDGAQIFAEVQAAHAALARFTAALRGRDYTGGYRYTDVKMLRMIASDKESGGIEGYLSHASARALQLRTDLLPDLSYLVSSKAAATRKLLEAALKKMMPCEKKNLGGGNWTYSGAFEGRNLKLWTDTGSMGAQLSYGVSVLNPAYGAPFSRIGYESFWGSRPSWDYLTEENVARSMDLLADNIVYLARLADRVNAAATG